MPDNTLGGRKDDSLVDAEEPITQPPIDDLASPTVLTEEPPAQTPIDINKVIVSRYSTRLTKRSGDTREDKR